MKFFSIFGGYFCPPRSGSEILKKVDAFDSRDQADLYRSIIFPKQQRDSGQIPLGTVHTSQLRSLQGRY